MRNKTRIDSAREMVRDEKSRAILNSNKEYIIAYQQNRAMIERINTLMKMIETLENRISKLEENGI